MPVGHHVHRQPLSQALHIDDPQTADRSPLQKELLPVPVNPEGADEHGKHQSERSKHAPQRSGCAAQIGRSQRIGERTWRQNRRNGIGGAHATPFQAAGVPRWFLPRKWGFSEFLAHHRHRLPNWRGHLPRQKPPLPILTSCSRGILAGHPKFTGSMSMIRVRSAGNAKVCSIFPNSMDKRLIAEVRSMI